MKGRTAKDIAAEIGEELIEVKQQLAHGEFMPWVSENCSFTHKRAKEYVIVARAKSTHGCLFHLCNSIREVLDLGKIKPEPKVDRRAAALNNFRKMEGLRKPQLVLLDCIAKNRSPATTYDRLTCGRFLTKTIPLIRAANVLPLVRWIEANRHRSGPYLAEADLDYWFALSPMDPIPLRSGIELLRLLARDHGPDIGTRIVNQASVAEIGFIGGVALGARSPIEALQRLSFAMPLHSSHESFRVGIEEDQVLIRHVLNLAIDDESLHAVHVLLISMLQQVVRFTGQQPPLLRRVEMMQHPESGLSHISANFADRLFATRSGMLTICIDLPVAQVPFQNVARDRSANPHIRSIPPLVEDRSLAASVRPVIAAMLHGGEPTIERIARAYGGSVRSLQRRLSEEATSYSELLDLVRKDLAISHLDGEDISLTELSERLGYSAQSALTRAVRRLTGLTPSQIAASRGP